MQCVAGMPTIHDGVIERRVRIERARLIAHGASAGTFAALVMGLCLMLITASDGASFFAPLEWIGAIYLRDTWAAHPALASFLGLATHLAFGASCGAAFALFSRRAPTMAARLAMAGMSSAGLFLAMTFVILPWVDPVLARSIDHGAFFLCHLTYAAALSLALPLPQAEALSRSRQRI
jgi:hypothetical protein